MVEAGMNQRSRYGVAHCSWLLAVAAALTQAADAAIAQGAEKPRSALAAWDTGKPAAEPLTVEAVAGKSGWQPVAAEETAKAVQGDVAISNGRLLAVAR